MFLVKEHFYDREEYKLINSQFTLDCNYEFYGEVFQEYVDKDMVYREIFDQVQRKGRSL